MRLKTANHNKRRMLRKSALNGLVLKVLRSGKFRYALLCHTTSDVCERLGMNFCPLPRKEEQ